MNSNVVQFFVLVAVVCCFQALIYYHFSCNFSGVVPEGNVSPTQNHPLIELGKRESADTKRGRVYACVFTGRWIYLRILLPYLYRELRQNGGVVDRVILVMIGYTEEAQSKLKNFVTAANSILKDEAFEFLYLKEDPSPPHVPGSPHLFPLYCKFNYVVFQRLLRNPSDVYFKMDDDIIYLHRNVFGRMINNKNTSECFLHFGNIVSNWIGNWLHQKIGVYDNEVNPKGLKFDIQTWAPCGWRSPECTEMALRTFIHHYHKKQLDRYLFRGRHLIAKGERFSINFFLLDVDIVNFERMMETGPIVKDDEIWWTMHYSSRAPQTNCMVGEALVVHFSYAITVKEMLDLGLLKEFENIVRIELGQTFPETLWNATDYS